MLHIKKIKTTKTKRKKHRNEIKKAKKRNVKCEKATATDSKGRTTGNNKTESKT